MPPPNATDPFTIYSPSYDGLKVEINATVDFVCQGGKKFADNFTKEVEVAMCQDNNTWTEIEGAGCVTSKFK